jgi:signal transduction histidine kinase
MRSPIRRQRSTSLPGAAGLVVGGGPKLTGDAPSQEVPKSPPAARSRRRLAALLVALGVASAVSVAAGVYLLVHNFHRYGYVRWAAGIFSYYGALGLSLALGIFGGLWLWWRAPRLATGRWLWLASTSLSLWVIGTFWPSGWGMQLSLFLYIYRPALAMVLLGWPTGRPSPKVRRWILTWFITYFVVNNGLSMFSGPYVGPHWPNNPLEPWNVAWVFNVVQPFTSWAFSLLPPAAVIVVLLRRLRGLPAGARHIFLPITITGVAVAGSDVVTNLVSLLPNRLVWDNAKSHSTLLGTVNFTQNYAQLGMAAVGVLIAFRLRQRAARAGARRLHLDLGRAGPVALPSIALRRLLGDETAQVIYPGPSGEWIDADGERVDIADPMRVVTKVLSYDGATVAAIDTARQRGVHPGLVEIAAATVLSSLQNDAAQAEANSRLADLRALQLELVEAMDDSRRSLESDLHDGAQQRLVGLALAARLSARSGDSPGARRDIAGQVRLARDEVLALLDSRVPVLLRLGLADALGALAATSAIAAQAATSGDLEPDDPLAKALWMIASEAVTNAEKHSGASHLRIELVVDTQVATLRVTDDGRGGVTAPPRAIGQRVKQARGDVTVQSSPGAGTELVVTCTRANERVPA